MHALLRLIAVLAGLAPLAAGAAAPVATTAKAEQGRAAPQFADGRNCRAYLPTIGATVAVPCPDQKDAPATRAAPPAPETRGGSGGTAEPDTSRPAQPPTPQRSMTAANTPAPAPVARDECRYYEPYLGRTIAIPCQESMAPSPVAAPASPAPAAASPAPAAAASQTKAQPATVNARITPAATPAPAPVAVGGGTSSCTSLIERAQLGNPLSIDDRERLRFECRR